MKDDEFKNTWNKIWIELKNGKLNNYENALNLLNWHNNYLHVT